MRQSSRMIMMRLICARRGGAVSTLSLLATTRSYSCLLPSAAAREGERSIQQGPRNNWSRDEIKAVYDSPILDLLFHGAQVHRHAHNFREVQQCTLLSVKTGGCSEDCSYCPQSSRYDTGVKAQKLMNKDAVLDAAHKAKEAGSTRFCMGAAWRDTVGRKTNFKQILEYVKEIRGMGMEVCCTLGMIEKQQAEELKEAGLTAYNHNLDTSREYYPNIITTRSYDERLETLKHVREAGINVCSGGIIGLGEAEDDRVGLLHTLATLPTHPESVPINALLAMKGTPLEEQKPVEVWEMIRMIASARITMPKAMMFKLLGLIPKAPDFSNDAKGKDFEAENCEVAISNYFHAQSKHNLLLQSSCSKARSTIISSSPQWTPPPARLVKFNCDEREVAVLGRNSTCQIVHGKGCWIKAISPLQSELFAIINLCRLSHVIIKSDCKMAIQLS
ncbi:Biotin synthase [Heracleum sosnowskyi]|uniref:Biotin synthase n=1 Tax=Heracleum sosnowskyi TaxID=360622 RepID=A0AAD8J576_9APIA|nr:Biotin synthase [Heracleum sosnowskyi]